MPPHLAGGHTVLQTQGAGGLAGGVPQGAGRVPGEIRKRADKKINQDLPTIGSVSGHDCGDGGEEGQGCDQGHGYTVLC